MKTYFCDGIDETKPRPKLIKSPSDEPPAPDGPKRTSQTRAPPKGYRPLPKTSPNGSITNSPASKRANKSSEPLLRELNNLEDSAVWVWWRHGACCNCVIKKAGLSWVRTPRGNQNTRISCNAVTLELELRPQYNYYITSGRCSVKTVLAVRDLLSSERPRQGKVRAPSYSTHETLEVSFLFYRGQSCTSIKMLVIKGNRKLLSFPHIPLSSIIIIVCFGATMSTLTWQMDVIFNFKEMQIID